MTPRFFKLIFLKDNAFSALGRKEDAIAVWEQGYVQEVTQRLTLHPRVCLLSRAETAFQPHDSVEAGNHAQLTHLHE